MLALEHVEELVLVLVDVERGVDGLVLLEDRHSTAGSVGGGPYLALVRVRGWKPEEYERWVADQLEAALLPAR